MMLYVMMFFGGALLCNAIPHLVSGLRGETFFTPWARPRGIGRSSPFQNFLWGSANLAVAVLMLTRTADRNVPHGLVAVMIGFLVMGSLLSILFGRRLGN